jgi:hypothetical protein
MLYGIKNKIPGHYTRVFSIKKTFIIWIISNEILIEVLMYI